MENKYLEIAEKVLDYNNPTLILEILRPKGMYLTVDELRNGIQKDEMYLTTRKDLIEAVEEGDMDWEEIPDGTEDDVYIEEPAVGSIRVIKAEWIDDYFKDLELQEFEGIDTDDFEVELYNIYKSEKGKNDMKPKKHFKVEVSELLAKTLMVQADSEQEAIMKIQQMYHDEEIVLTADDFHGNLDFRIK